MILKLQFSSCSKSLSGIGTSWALPIVMKEKENNSHTWENKVLWSVMFACFNQKRKVSQQLESLLNNNLGFPGGSDCRRPGFHPWIGKIPCRWDQKKKKKGITSGCPLSASHWSMESTSVNQGAGPDWNLLPSGLSSSPIPHVTSSLWSLTTYFSPPGQTSCYKRLILCGVFCFWKGQKTTTPSSSPNWKAGPDLPFTLEKWWKFPRLWLMTGNA